ncbi:MAG: RNA polymerase sigma factor [Patescibacteria group bacterium]|jgi:RNA polymerase sigma-70 factor (ECF subfamily)
MTQLVDRYLLYRIRAKRDAEAFAKIYDRHVESIFRFVVYKLPKKEDAQDVTAEAFTRLWQTIQQPKQITNVRAFLYQIARNLVADFYRKFEQSPIESIDVTFESDNTSNQLYTDKGRHSEQIEARSELSIVLGQLDKLKEDYRDVLALRLIDGLSFQEIGTILGKEAGHARVIYHRGLKAIKQANEPTP